MSQSRSEIEYRSPSAPRRISRTSVQQYMAGFGACVIAALSALIDEEVACAAALIVLLAMIYLQFARRWTAFSLGVATALGLAVPVAAVGLLWLAVAMRGF
jgi:hypothetical protein